MMPNVVKEVFRALPSDHRRTLRYYVKRNLEYGLGDAWADYMATSVDLAIEDMTALNEGD